MGHRIKFEHKKPINLNETFQDRHKLEQMMKRNPKKHVGLEIHRDTVEIDGKQYHVDYNILIYPHGPQIKITAAPVKFERTLDRSLHTPVQSHDVGFLYVKHRQIHSGKGEEGRQHIFKTHMGELMQKKGVMSRALQVLEEHILRNWENYKNIHSFEETQEGKFIVEGTEKKSVLSFLMNNGYEIKEIGGESAEGENQQVLAARLTRYGERLSDYVILRKKIGD